MNSRLPDNDPTLKQVLSACYECWVTTTVPEEQRETCFRWVDQVFRRMFCGTFHQSRLQRLADLGFLIPGDTARGGNRRYYRLADPHAVRDLLTETEPSR